MNRDGRAESRNETRDSSQRQHDSGHWRNNSGTSVSASEGYADPNNAAPVRRHDYDIQSMESELSPRNSMANPIHPPTVTVKSEFPTLTRSKVQQSLTCLVTIEVPQRKWQPMYNEEVPPIPSLPAAYDQQYQPPSPTGRSQYSFERESSSARQQREREAERERELEALASITEDLRLRVENWHGLDFAR